MIEYFYFFRLLHDLYYFNECNKLAKNMQALSRIK